MKELTAAIASYINYLLSAQIKVQLMDVSYSAWQQSIEERLTLKGENFSFLFDRRYTNRLNRMSRVFFDAYVRATKEIAAQEDRFPSLSEIDARMESGSVYAFKDRLIKNTEFFEEVKISWVIYLVPRAKIFSDASGTYTDLVFNFDEGTVMLPSRRKAPVQTEPTLPQSEKPDQPQKDEASIEAEESSPKQIDTTADIPQDTFHLELAPESPATVAEEKTQSVTGAKTNNSADRPSTEDAASFHEVKTQKTPGKGEDSRGKIKIAALGLATLIVIVAAVLYFSSFKVVYYSILISNSSQGNSLDLNITNQDGFDDEIEMVLPLNIYKSMISRGGVITISSDSSTSIRLSTSGDASVRLYLAGNWTMIPVTLSLTVPKGQDSELKFVRGDYNVKNMDDRIILRFNCTQEALSFEQRMRRWF